LIATSSIYRRDLAVRTAAYAGECSLLASVTRHGVDAIPLPENGRGRGFELEEDALVFSRIDLEDKFCDSPISRFEMWLEVAYCLMSGTSRTKRGRPVSGFEGHPPARPPNALSCSPWR
jgi:hypothetical protein